MIASHPGRPRSNYNRISLGDSYRQGPTGRELNIQACNFEKQRNIQADSFSADLGILHPFFFIKWAGTYVTRYCGHFWPIVQPQMIDEGDCGAIGGMKIGRGYQSTRRKPAPAPFCPPQIPLDQTRARTRAAAVGSQRLTA
jgi:hypothetical protein